MKNATRFQSSNFQNISIVLFSVLADTVMKVYKVLHVNFSHEAV